MTGVMALQLNLVLVNENKSFAQVIEWERGIGDGMTIMYCYYINFDLLFIASQPVLRWKHDGRTTYYNSIS